MVNGDKIVLKKEYGNLKFVGEMFEVGNITDTSIVIRNVKNKVAVASISIDDFYEYFSEVEQAKQWTKWTKFIVENGKIAFYRTNQKKVQVKIDCGTETFKGESCCNTDEDEFNLYYGLNIAYCRCKIKKLQSIKNKYKDAINEINKDIGENRVLIDNIIRNM